MSRPRTKTREQILERKRRYSVEYRKRNAERIRAYKQSEHYRELHREHNRKWLARHPGYIGGYLRKWRKNATVNGVVQMFTCKHCGDTFQRAWCGHGKAPHTCDECFKKQRRAAWKRYVQSHPRHAQKRRIMEELRLRLDPQAYARSRVLQRERGRKMRDRKIAAGLLPPRTKNGGMYKPRHSIRYPDWCVKGQHVADVRSQWLIENRTLEQLAYVRELFIERRERRERMCR